MADPDSVSDDVLDKAQETITSELKKKSLPRGERVMLETLGYFLIFLRSDHHKVNEMYPYFQKLQEKDSRWEPRVWDIVKGISLLIVGAVIASL